jgi:hypothetical protein
MKTKKGSKIERYKKYGVGKYISGSLYLHWMDFLVLQVNTPELKKKLYQIPHHILKDGLGKEIVIRLDKDGTISLIHCPDFWKVHEPELKERWVIKPDGVSFLKLWTKNDPVLHHKWLLVKEEIPEAVERSKEILAIGYPASKVGRRLQWHKWCKENGVAI